MGKPLITIRQAAKQYNLPESSLRKMHKEGKLEGVQLKNRFYISVAALEKQLGIADQVTSVE